MTRKGRRGSHEKRGRRDPIELSGLNGKGKNKFFFGRENLGLGEKQMIFCNNITYLY